MALCLKDLLRSIISPEKNWKTNLLYQWRDIIGPLESKVRIEKIYDDTLVLGVFHSCWMQELYLLSPLLIKNINERLDQPRIKQLRFKYIGIKNVSHKKEKRISIPKKYVQLTSREESTLVKITDPGLRDVLKAFRLRCYQES